MINPKLSLQNFQQNIIIQKRIGQKLGYTLDNIPYSPKTRSQQKKQYLLLNDNIDPLKVIQKQVQYSPRHKELINEIQQLHIQKQVNKMMIQQKGKEQQFNVSQFLNSKIRQYNYLVDHKHLMNKPKSLIILQSSKKRRQSMGQRQKQDDSLVQKIRTKQQQLMKTASLMSRISRNKQIFEIYRNYSNSLKQKKRPSFSFQRPNKLADVDVRISAKIKQKQQDHSKIKKQRYDQQINIQYPYINNAYLKNSKQFNENLRRSRKMESIMKQKLDKVRSLSYSQNLQIQKQNIGDSHKNKSQLQNKFQQLNYSKIYQAQNEVFRNLKNDRSQALFRQQQTYLQKGMRKMSPKYIKQQDSKFVTHYKIDKIARQMLEGISGERKKQVKFNIPRMHNRKLKIPKELNEEDKMVMKMMIQEQDDIYYWTTCRNQKINLMLKGKKHQ